jgi:integrase
MAVATIRKRGEKFEAQVRMAGYPSRTETFPTRKQAERWATTIEAQMIEGRHFRGSEARTKTVAEAIDKYAAEVLPHLKDGSMHRAYLPWWRERLRDVKLMDVTPALLTRCRNELERTPYVRAKPSSSRSLFKDQAAPKYTRSRATVGKYLRVLSSVFTCAIKDWQWMAFNPVASLRLPQEGEGRERVLSDEEREQLFRETRKVPTLHLLVVLALSTCARAGELLKLTWANVDLKSGRLRFINTKNGSSRTVWIFAEALELLKEHARVRSLTDPRLFRGIESRPGRKVGQTYDYADAFEEALTRAGIEDVRFHDLRHSAATYLAIQGATEQQLKAIGGWKSNVVKKYVHIAANQLRDPMRELAEKVASGRRAPKVEEDDFEGVA